MVSKQHKLTVIIERHQINREFIELGNIEKNQQVLMKLQICSMLY